MTSEQTSLVQQELFEKLPCSLRKSTTLDNGGAKGVTSTGIFNNAVTKIDGLEDGLQVLLKDSKRVIPVADIRKVTDPLVQKYRAAGLTGDAQMMTSQIDELEKFHGKAIPVEVANEVKRTLYDKVRNGYGELSTESKEGYKAIARALKEGIASKVKGVDVANKELRRTGRIADSMLEKMTKDERAKTLNLMDFAVGGGGIAAFGIPGIAAIAGKKAIESTVGQKTIMNTLNTTSKVAGKVGSIPGVSNNAPKVGAIGGMTVADSLSSRPNQSDETYNQSDETGKDSSGNKLDHNGTNYSINGEESQVQFVSPDGQWQTKTDGKSYSMDNQWVFDDAAGDWIANPNPTSGDEQNPEAPMSQSQYAAQLSALAQDSSTAAVRQYGLLEKERDYYYPESKESKLPVSAQEKVNLAKSGVRGLRAAKELYEKDPSVTAKQLIPGKWMSRQFDSAMFRTVEALLRRGKWKFPVILSIPDGLS